MAVTTIGALVFAVTASSQAAPPQMVTPLIENERVIVRKYTLEAGRPGMLRSHQRDFVELVLAGGKIRTTDLSGKTHIEVRKFGDAIFGKKATVQKEELLSGGPAQIVEVELKEYADRAPANMSGYPAAFPRSGARNVLDNDRVAAWTFTWKMGESTPMHYHAADIVGVFRYKGQVRSTQPSGHSSLTSYTPGEVRYTRGNRIHSETLVSGRESAILLELK